MITITVLFLLRKLYFKKKDVILDCLFQIRQYLFSKPWVLLFPIWLRGNKCGDGR